MNRCFLQGFQKQANLEKLRGGEADNVPDEAFDPKELKKGTKVEAEHTDNETKAKEIAKDHLSEGMNYYKELEKMEEKLGGLNYDFVEKGKQADKITEKIYSKAYKALGSKKLNSMGSSQRSKVVNAWAQKNHPKHKDLFPLSGF